MLDSLLPMTATLDQIHRDPAILDRAIESQQALDIVSHGRVAANLTPNAAGEIEEARRIMAERFAAVDWSFAVGVPLNRDERNARPHAA